MKMMHYFLTQKTAQNAAKFMKIICYIVIGLLIMMLALSLMGRLQYHLSFGNENYPSAIYAEKNHNFHSRSLTVNSSDNLRIRTQSADGQIELISYITIIVVYALDIILLILAYWFLSKLFSNVSKGVIFVKENANYLLYYGAIQAIVAVVIPFIKLLIVQIANMLVTDRLSLSTGSRMFNQLIPSIAFLVAAYIINYGVDLQDEVDHTL